MIYEYMNSLLLTLSYLLLRSKNVTIISDLLCIEWLWHRLYLKMYLVYGFSVVVKVGSKCCRSTLIGWLSMLDYVLVWMNQPWAARACPIHSLAWRPLLMNNNTRKSVTLITINSAGTHVRISIQGKTFTMFTFGNCVTIT